MAASKSQKKGPIRAIRMQGPVTVSYRNSGKNCYCTALQFDLVGIGTSKTEAFRELRDVFNTYLIEIVQTDGPSEFLNPSPAEEWSVPEREEYYVVALGQRQSTVF